MKKVFSLVLALMFLLSAAALAGEPVKITDEPAELDIWVSVSTSIEDFETNQTTLWYEEKTGVHVNWTQVSSAETATKFNLSIASNEYPDIYSYALKPDQVIQYANAGIFIPLNDLIDEHAPNIKAVFDANPEVREAITAPDGNIYTLLRTDPATYTLVEDKLFVMADWLNAYIEATGNEAPVTLDEFEEMLIYWRDNDMNGNGEKDEIAIMGSDGGANIIRFLASSFQLTPTNYMIVNEDNTVSYAPVTDEFREALIWINHLYEEGLIAEETFIQDSTQLKSVVGKEDKSARTVGSFVGFWQGVAASPAAMSDAYDAYVALAPLEGDDGVRQCSSRGFFTLDLCGAITKDCEDPVLAIKWLDWWFSYDGMIMIDYGMEGINWEWVDTPAINGTTPARAFLTDRNVLQNVHWHVNSVPYYRTIDSLFGRAPTDHVPYLYEGALVYEPYEVAQGFPQLAWCTDMDVLNENNELSTVIGDYILQALVQFVTGAEDIEDDAAWENFKSTLDTLGLERYLETVSIINFGE